MTNADDDEIDAKVVAALRDAMAWIAVGSGDTCTLSAVQKRFVAFVWVLTPEITRRGSLAELAREIGCDADSLYTYARELSSRLASIEKAGQRCRPLVDREVGADLLQ